MEAAGEWNMRTAAKLMSCALTIWLAAMSGASSAGLFEEQGGLSDHGRAVPVRRAAEGRPLTPKQAAALGYKYEHGVGVPQSYEMAVDYYTEAAEHGDANGQYLLGLMYDKGHGVRQDGVLAHMWLNLAASHAPRRFRDYFLNMRNAEASKMTPAQIVAAQRLAVEWVPKP